jgi:hypothetical protein
MTVRLQGLISKLQELFPDGPQFGKFTNWANPPLDVLDCVLSLNRSYDSFCLPRVQSFSDRHPEIDSLQALLSLIRSYQSPLEFSIRELDYRDEARAETLVGVLNYLLTAQRSISGDSEEKKLLQWAESVKPQDYVSLGVRGFGLAGFQYLRMLLGAQAAKPDIHIRRFVSDAVGYKVGDAEDASLLSDAEALSLLEEACAVLKWALTDLDYEVWEKLARGPEYEDNWTYRLEVDGRSVNMPALREAEVVEQGRCLYAALPAGTRIEFRCAQLDERGRPYRSWRISKPRDLSVRAARGQELALQYGLLDHFAV